jgi:hypothetical protein
MQGKDGLQAAAGRKALKNIEIFEQLTSCHLRLKLDKGLR